LVSSTDLSPSIQVAAGLTAEEAARRLATDGPNQLTGSSGQPWPRLLLAQFTSPLVLVLIAAALVSRLLGERIEATVILLIVGLNALLGFGQEYRAERALRALRRYVTRTARAKRDGRVIEIPAAELVRGDLIELELGDLVPADVRVLTADNLSLDESTLTGESTPVARQPGELARMGAALLSGYGTGEVVATGRATLLGRTATLLTRKPEETDFQRNIRRFSDFLVGPHRRAHGIRLRGKRGAGKGLVRFVPVRRCTRGRHHPRGPARHRDDCPRARCPPDGPRTGGGEAAHVRGRPR